MKCDEERPTCSKCRSTGRVCDGYEAKQIVPEPTRCTRVQLFPADTTLAALSIISGPTIGIVGTDQERRSFAFFCYQVGQQLSTALNITKIHQFILQASHCDEAVRSAVIALGSIGERLSINNLLTPDNEQANACHDFAVFQYCKALKRLRERISNKPEGSANLAIILCFLFTIFEFLQGNDTASLVHLRSGLKILRRGQTSVPTGLWTVPAEQDPVTHEILRVYSIMDMQATVWLGLKTFQAPIMIPLDGPGDVPAHLDRFSTLDDASQSLNYRIASAYYFRRLTDVHETGESPDQVPLEVIAKKEELRVQLKEWPISLEALIRKLSGELNTEMSQRIAVLKINYETVLMILTACLQPSDRQFYADHELEFRKIVALAKSVVGPMSDLEHIVAANNSDKNPEPLFSFYIGVIQPLYFTAIKCRNLDICREAIALLSSSPWREGAWDSASMARIAARRLQEDDEKMYEPGSSGAARVLQGYMPREDSVAVSQTPSASEIN